MGPNGLISSGRGIVADTITTLYKTFEDSHDLFMTELSNGHSSIKCQRSGAFAAYVEPSRLEELFVFGASAALMMCNGQYATGLSPALILFIVYDCNLHALRPEFVLEWFPNIQRMVASWLSRSHADNGLAEFTGFFATYFDVQVSELWMPLLSLFNDKIYRLEPFTAELRQATRLLQQRCFMHRYLVKSHQPIPNGRHS